MFAVSITIQLPQVQTAIAKRFVSNLSEKIQGEITFEKIHFKPFTTFILKNVLIIDKNPVPHDVTGVQVDTFFRAQYIIAKFTMDGLITDGRLNLDKVFISNAQMNLVLESPLDSLKGVYNAESLTRIFGIEKGKEREKSDKDLFHIRKVEILNMGFTMKNHRVEKIPFHGGINWNDLDIRDININAHDLGFKGGVMSGILEQLTFKEKSGWSPESISGEATVGNGKTLIKDLHITDRWSDLKLPEFIMTYRNSKVFANFNEEVKIDGNIAPSSLDFRTLHYFAPQLKNNRIKARVSGQMSGYVSDFEIKNMDIAVKEGGFAGKLNGRITGLPEIENTRIDARLNNFLLTTRGAGDFISAWMQEGELDLSDYAKGIMFSLNGSARGKLDDLKASISISSLLGRARTSVRLRHMLDTLQPLDISGSAATENLDIGSIIGKQIIRHTTAKAGFGAKFGRTLTFPDITLDSLSVERLALNGYDYSGITADGYINIDSFEGEVISDDPNLNFMIKASQSTQDSLTVYDLNADIAKADLAALNIDHRGRSEVSFITSGNYTVARSGSKEGQLCITGLNLTNDGKSYDFDDINLTTKQYEKEYDFLLMAPFAEASYSGDASLKQFINDLKNLTVKKEIPALFSDSTYVRSNNAYKADLVFHNTMDILAFALPGMYIEEGTSIHAQIDEDGEFHADINSGRIAYGAEYLKGLSAVFNNQNENLNGEMHCEAIQIRSIKLNDNKLQVFSKNNQIGASYSYNNDAELENHGHIVVHSELSRNKSGLNFEIDLAPSTIYFNSKGWDVLPSKINISGQDITVNSLGLVSGDEAISINGRSSKTKNDTLTFALQRFDISLINSLIPELGISGAVTGTAKLTSSAKEKGLEIKMLCDSTYVADTPLGILELGGEWNSEEQKINMSVINNLDGEHSIDASANLYLKERNLDAKIDMNSLKVSYVKPLLTDIFSELDGSVSGSVMLSGSLDSLNISSVDCRLDEGLLKIDYTNVPYYADGTFHLDSQGVYFDEVTVRDRFNGTGSIHGSIGWNNFKDINYNLEMKVNDIEGINLIEGMNETFYGNIFGTGNLSLTGTSKSVQLNVDAVTSRAGQIHIPVTDVTTASTNLLKFTEVEKEIYIDPYEAMMTDIKKKNEAAAAEFNVNIRVSASPDIEAFVEIDKANGNVLSGRGNGILDMAVSSDAFRINGDYTLTGGNYKFVTMGLVSRDFEIQDGSSVRFNGEILESSLDINAIYKTKASLSTLIADTTSVSNRRTVECGISITDKIINPRLSFSIAIPDLDPTIKSRVESALSTEDKVQKQFLSLILSNSFLPDEQSGIVNNSSMLYSNVTEMLANQLSTIFQKLDIPLDLGLNYQPNEKGNDIFDVAVSTQLFNNRVVVNGSVGNKQYNTGETQDVVGDLDIEIKLNRSGSFRLNLFSHSADSYTNFLDNSQRNGVGLTYQTEFNNFGQFVKNMFRTKAKRQAAKQAEEQAIIDGGKVEIEIEASTQNTKDGKR